MSLPYIIVFILRRNSLAANLFCSADLTFNRKTIFTSMIYKFSQNVTVILGFGFNVAFSFSDVLQEHWG